MKTENKPIPGTKPVFGIEPTGKSFLSGWGELEHQINAKSQQRLKNSASKRYWRSRKVDAGTWKK